MFNTVINILTLIFVTQIFGVLILLLLRINRLDDTIPILKPYPEKTDEKDGKKTKEMPDSAKEWEDV